MPKSMRQKGKLLALIDILSRKTDESHPLALAQIQSLLETTYGISAERKSLYDDMETLREYGYDVVSVRAKQTGYFLGERQLELAELKLLVDAVQSSRFLTKKKSDALISKLSSLTNEHNAHALARQVHIANRVKTMNESIFYTVDDIHTAILEEKRIRFRYFSWTAKKEKLYRRDGAFYTVSPFALTWDSENYYLIGFDSDKREIRHFRVDKMTHVSVTALPREGMDAYRSFDTAGYTQSVFGMYAGKRENVTLRVSARLAGVIIDRFGQEPVFRAESEETFLVTLAVSVSPNFFGWLAGLGADIEIVSPIPVRDAFREHVLAISKVYSGD